MNAVEIEEAVSKLASEPFDPKTFPYAFLEAFGNKPTTIAKLKSGASNGSDVPGGLLQHSNIHLAVCAPGKVTSTLAALKASPATQNPRKKIKFILATDGETIEAEDLSSAEGGTLACSYAELPNHFGFFLALAGITTVAQIRDNAFDIRATSRLNRLYIELVKDNPEWDKQERRHDLNQFMARLIFCFFAENTGIFHGEQLFTRCIDQMTEAKPASKFGNTHEVIQEIFRAMDAKVANRGAAGIRPYADSFDYVNGGLFSGNKDVPKFSRTARSYLLHAGALPWQQINPDIFGSMIQAVADDEERGNLGLHYTSVPNILKVLNPLFLDSLREQLEQAGGNPRKLLNLRKRMAQIRVFDPACGSGNFLVISYKEMRRIEAEIIRRRNDEKKSWIKLTNFYGIEIKDFATEIAKLALLIAEFQCDVEYIGRREALLGVLPLKETGQIHADNALRLDWLKICPPVARKMVEEHDLAGPTGRLLLEGDAEEGSIEPETYVCGNPPYKGSTWQTEAQKDDLKVVFTNRCKSWKSLDYVAGWYMKTCDYGQHTKTISAFVSTNSICQGQQVPILWPLVFTSGHEITFGHTSFKWANLASRNAGVTVIIVGLTITAGKTPRLFDEDENGRVVLREVTNINAYLVPGANIIVEKRDKPFSELAELNFGNKPVDGGHLLMTTDEVESLSLTLAQRARFIRHIYGSAEFIRGLERYCLWIDDDKIAEAVNIEPIRKRIAAVREMRKSSSKAATRLGSQRPHRFDELRQSGREMVVIVPSVSSESRYYFPVGYLSKGTIISNLAFALYDAPLWNMALIASRLHLVWIATVCGKLETRYRYSNTLGWNTFPVPTLTEKMKADLTRCAGDILLAREHYFPATIADMYDPDRLDAEFPLVREAHERNDEVLERIYIGRRFKNDTERLEKMFDLYTKMTVSAANFPKVKAAKRASKKKADRR